MLDLPQRSVVLAGLDSWVGSRRQIREPRLAHKVAVLLGLPAAGVPAISLECPPEAERDDLGCVPAYVFPLWFVTANLVPGGPLRWRTRRLVSWRDLEDQGRHFSMADGSKSPVTPVPYVRGCRRGHLGDIDWPVFVHGFRQPCGGALYFDERGSSGDLREVFIRCACREERPLSMLAQAADVSDIEGAPIGLCDGARPWLAASAAEKCSENNRLLLRAGAGAWLAQSQSVISLPEHDEKIRQAVNDLWIFLQSAESAADVEDERRKPRVRDLLAAWSNQDVWETVRERKEQLSGMEKPAKLAEIEMLLTPRNEIGVDRLGSVLFARVLPRPEWDRPWMAGIERVLLLERLREVTALVGFNRFESVFPDAETGELDAGARRAALSLRPAWAPAGENCAEGIFIQFDPGVLENWRRRAAVQIRYGELNQAFGIWRKDHSGPGRRMPSAEYVLLHSFSHLLIAAMCVECGYPAASIRERVYAVPNAGYGILLFTAGSDAAGSLGGFVEAGRKIARLARIAQGLGNICSNDPVCGQHNGAACQACLQMAEMACEQGNSFLDRALVVATVAGTGTGFFPEPE
jgi:hypothetical protein